MFSIACAHFLTSVPRPCIWIFFDVRIELIVIRHYQKPSSIDQIALLGKVEAVI